MKKNNQPQKWTFSKYAEACEKKDSHCISAIHGLLQDQPLWGRLQANYKKIANDWFPAKLQIRFTDGQHQAGRQMLEQKGRLIVPVIELDKTSSPHEMLITLNHEISHVRSLERHIGVISKKEKLKSCMTEFQWLRLKDETNSFKEEIVFWKSAPTWFRAHFKEKKISSRIISSSQNYESYYKQLGLALAKDDQFVLKKYIGLKEAPSCASQLLAQSH